MIERSAMDELRPRIAVIGVGGAGGNAVSSLIVSNAPGIDFILANTDAQALNRSPCGRLIQLGRKVTEGLGAGSLAAIGKAAAEESVEEISAAIKGAHMCFIAAGMGGGTGTGAASVIAKAAHDQGILTIAVVTMPFAFEGGRRARAAAAGIEELQKHVDTLIVIPNQNLFRIANPNTTLKEAFKMSDEVLQQGVRGITDLMVMPGLVNLDFADVRSVMHGMGRAMMGSGEAGGDNRALEAAEMAVASPLLDGAIKGARGIIISITGGEDMRLMEIDEAAHHIKDMIDPEADIIWGSAINPEFEGRMRVSIVATGLDAETNFHRLPVQPPISLFAAPSAPATALAEAEPAALPPVLYADLFEPAAKALPDTLLLNAPALDTLIMKMVDGPSAADPVQADAARDGASSIRGPSLFERMTQAVRDVARHDPRFVQSSAMRDMDAPGVYNRRGSLKITSDNLRSPVRLIGVRSNGGAVEPATQAHPSEPVLN